MEQFLYNDSVETDIFTYYPPLAPIRGFVSIPHSGLIVPEEFKEYLSPTLTPNDMNCDVDYAVDQLIDIKELQEAGIALMVAKVHRVCIDLNRSPDIAVFSWKDNTQGVNLVTKMPSDEIVKSWIEQYHQPYFHFMKEVVDNISNIKLGFVSLLDLHSMPSKPTAYHLKKNPQQSTERRKDFCLSDLKGLSCQKVYIASYQDALQYADYSVAINDPYFGGYVTQYMDETFQSNVIQCEINRDIYMDEVKQCLIEEKVKELKPVLTKTIKDIYVAFNTPFTVNQENGAEGYEKDEIDAQFAFGF